MDKKSPALEYHSGSRPGKISVVPVKPCDTAADLGTLDVMSFADKIRKHGGSMFIPLIGSFFQISDSGKGIALHTHTVSEIGGIKDLSVTVTAAGCLKGKLCGTGIIDLAPHAFEVAERKIIFSFGIA